MWWNAWSVRESAAGIAVPAARRFRKAVSLAGETDFSNAVGGSLPAGKGAPPIFGGRAEKAGPPAAFIAVMPGGFFLWIPARSWPRSGAHFFTWEFVRVSFPPSLSFLPGPEAGFGRVFRGLFSSRRVAFQTLRPVVSRKKRGFSAHFWPGGAVLPPRVSPFSKLKRSSACRGVQGRIRG